MNRYIEQLVEDIRMAAGWAPHLNEGRIKLSTEEELEQHFDDIENFLHGELEKLADIVGIPLKMLPAPERINQRQKEILADELTSLLNAWNFYPDFPENLPAEMKYKALLDVWESEQTYMRSGEAHIEFCNYDPANCPFPGYCQNCDLFSSDAQDVNNDFTGGMEDGWMAPDNLISSDFPEPNHRNTEENYIEGIYNFCDQWCERCDFTDRCRNLKDERIFDQEVEKHNTESEEKMEDLPDENESLTEEKDDFLSFESDEESDYNKAREDFFSSYQKTKRHPLSILSDEYSWAVHKWLLQQHKIFKKDITRWIARGQADEMINGFDVLLWYHFFIHVKLKRAINGYYELQDFEFAEYDMNGTAKIAMIAIERSLEAMRIMNRHLKTERPAIEQFRAQLEKIRIMTEEMFPEARSFIRPGFDE